MDIREIVASRVPSDGGLPARSESLEIQERFQSLLQQSSGEQLKATRAESDLISKGTLPFLQIDHQRYTRSERNAFERAIDCSGQKFMHTFFSGMTQEELIAKSYVGGLLVAGAGVAATKFSPRLGQAMIIGGFSSNMFGAMVGIRWLNGLDDNYSRTPTCKIFGGSER